MSHADFLTGLHANMERIRAARIMERVRAHGMAEGGDIGADVIKASGGTDEDVAKREVAIWRASQLETFRSKHSGG